MIAIVPARKGSKRFPNKNKSQFLGKGLVEHTIEQAILSRAFKQIIVSTDDEDIQSIFDDYSGVTLRRRPEEFSTDLSTSEVVLMDVLDHFSIFEGSFCLLQVTSPLRTAKTIQQATSKFTGVSLVSCCRISQHDDHHKLSEFSCFQQQYHSLKDQEFFSAHKLNGSIYIHRVDIFRRNPKLVNENCKFFLMPRWQL